MSPARCKCGCNALAPTENRGGFASQSCYLRWVARQRPVLDDAQITAMRTSGASLEAIGKAVGWGKAVVGRRLRALGVKAPERPTSTARSHRAAVVLPVAPGRHHTKSLPFRRVGSYQHPRLGPWAFGCPCCAQHILGPMVEGLPAWKGQTL